MTIKEMINSLSIEKDSLRKENARLNNKIAELTESNLALEHQVADLTNTIDVLREQLHAISVVEEQVETPKDDTTDTTETVETTETTKKKRTRKKKTEE